MTSENKSVSAILASVVCVLSLAANADRHWTGGGETTDWSDSANWRAGNGSGNWVFGGGQIGSYPSSPDPVVVTFSNLVTIANGIWIENENKPDVVWEVSESAAEGAGLKSTWGTNNSLNIGTGKHGGLTIKSGVYYMPKQLWIGNGAVDSYFTLNGGVFTNGSYTCIGYGGYDRTATMTVSGGSYRQNGNVFIVGQGNHANCAGIFNLTAGSVDTAGDITCSENQGSSQVNISGGSLLVNGQLKLAEGKKGVARTTMNVSDGSVKIKGQIQVAKGSESKGHVEVHGGEVVCNNLFQVGLNGTGTLEMDGGSVTCNGFRLGTDGASAVGTATITGGKLTSTAEVRVGGNGTGTLNINGGVVEANKVDVGTGTGTLNLDGGTLKARQDEATAFLANSANLTVNVGAGGAVFDTAGHNVTVPATLNNAAELAGANGMIWKKGLGTLTISSNLDLERTFKFTIHDGIGPIALTGSNTFGGGKKISVMIDPVSATTNVAYTVLTGLGELTMDDIEITGDDFYTYTGAVADGTLTVTLAYGPTAPVTARYVNGKWGFYNAEGNLIQDGEAADLTSYIFTGAEPTSELATVAAAGRTIILEAVKDGDNGVTNTIALASNLTATRVVVSTEEGCAVALSGDNVELTIAELVNNGTLVFDGEITLDATLADGNVVLSDVAVVHLVKTQNIKALVSGSGELSVENAELTIQNDSVDNGLRFFRNFAGTLTVGEGSILHDLTGLHAENVSQGYYFLGEHSTLKMVGGRISRFGGATNNEHINNVVIAEGTTNVWNNYQSRSGWLGCNVFIKGTFTGTGMLQANISGRSYRFSDGLSGFGGIVEMSGSAFQFDAGINGGTWIANTNAVLIGWNGSARIPIAVDDATLVLKGGHRAVSGVTAGTYSIGANAALKVGESASVEGVTFAAGATLEMLDEGALSDRTHEYVALTSATPITGALPTLVQPPDVQRGKWKLVQKTIPGEDEDPDTYRIVAEFRPSGFMIIVQ